MSLVFATKAKLTAIANAIRTRAGSVASMTLDDMADAIPALPNTYAAGDEGKVVDNGALVSQTSTNATANGTYDTTLNNEVVVAVPGPSGTLSITQNGTGIDVSEYAAVDVDVSGGGSTPRLLNHVELTPVTSGVNQTVQLTASDDTVIITKIREIPSAPDASYYIGLSCLEMFNSITNARSEYGFILRPAGTIGTDNWTTYDHTTGALTIGGGYGKLIAGMTVDIYQFDMERGM